MATGTTAKPKNSKWWGVLDQSSKTLRYTAFVVLVIGIISQTFVQIGFIGIGLPGAYVGYGVALLVPVALGALLFGLLQGVLLGLLAGVTLYVHSQLQPLDYYEVLFITPWSSIVLFTIAGLVLALLFVFVLRKDPPVWRRILYIILVCFLVSVLFSIFFFVNVLIEIAITIMPSIESMDSTAIETDIVHMATRYGSFNVQVLFDAVAMSIMCIIGDVLSLRLKQKGAVNISLRTTFRLWLLIDVGLAFMLTSAVSFIAATEQEKATADKNMESEVSYLCSQLELGDGRRESLNELLASYGTSTADMELDDLEKYYGSVNNMSLLEGYSVGVDGTVFILNEGFIFMTDDQRLEEFSTVREKLGPEIEQAIQTAVETGKMQGVVFDPIELDSDEYDLADETITTEIGYLRAQQQDPYTVVMIMPSSMVFADRGSIMLWVTVSSAILLLVVFFLASRLIADLVMRRIDEANGVLKRITEGDLEARVDIHDSTEFESLSNGVNTTVEALRGWIAEAETRIDRELATAKTIQESALPRVFPPYPDILKFDVYASMNPAREVGGDFYDFFLIGDDSGADGGKLGFVIADVSGKGVPAALFMMNAKAQIRGYVGAGGDIGEAMENVNHQLCEGNDAGMFVTAFVGVLDYGTGHVTYVNAGHNPTLLWQAGSWEWLKQRSGLPLGLFDGMPYKSFEVDLSIGDEFFLYTDGVTEAFSVEGGQYGEERLMSLVSKFAYYHPRQMIHLVSEDVADFSEGAEQSDDITMLSLEYGVAPEITAALTVPARVEELDRVISFVSSELDNRLCPMRTQNQISVAVEELFVNVARYAYPDAPPDKPGKVIITRTYSAEPPSLTVQLIDEGIPYDPTAKPDAVTPDNIADVPIGGLGILMVKRSVDEMHYEYVDNCNVVTIVKKW